MAPEVALVNADATERPGLRLVPVSISNVASRCLFQSHCCSVHATIIEAEANCVIIRLQPLRLPAEDVLVSHAIVAQRSVTARGWRGQRSTHRPNQQRLHRSHVANEASPGIGKLPLDGDNAALLGIALVQRRQETMEGILGHLCDNGRRAAVEAAVAVVDHANGVAAGSKRGGSESRGITADSHGSECGRPVSEFDRAGRGTGPRGDNTDRGRERDRFADQGGSL